MGKLYKKIVLLTESTSTLSQTTAKLAAKEDAIVICADKNIEKATSLLTEIRSFAGQCDALQLHVKSLDSWRVAIKYIVEHYGKIDVLVNTLGLAVPKLLSTLSAYEQEMIYETNIETVLYGLETVLPIMKDNRGGSVINVASFDGLTNLNQYHIYVKTNKIIQTLLESKAIEYSKSNIRINSICPSTVSTPLLETTFPKINVQYKQTILFPYLGKAKDIANGIIYLASDETSFISGAKLVISGNNMPT